MIHTRKLQPSVEPESTVQPETAVQPEIAVQPETAVQPKTAVTPLAGSLSAGHGSDSEPETVTLLMAVPELAPRYLALAEAADGDPGAAAVFEALADHVADLLGRPQEAGPQLARCLAVVERIAAHAPDAEDLVGWGFLDNLSPAERLQLRPWTGPCTAALADSVDTPFELDAR